MGKREIKLSSEMKLFAVFVSAAFAAYHNPNLCMPSKIPIEGNGSTGEFINCDTNSCEVKITCDDGYKLRKKQLQGKRLYCKGFSSSKCCSVTRRWHSGRATNKRIGKACKKVTEKNWIEKSN